MYCLGGQIVKLFWLCPSLSLFTFTFFTVFPLPLYIINNVYFPFFVNYCPLCIHFIKFPWFFLCNPLPVRGIILPLHSQNGNDLLHDWRKRRCAIKERVLWKIFVDRNCSTSAVLYLYMVTDVRNKLVNSLSKVSDFNKKTDCFTILQTARAE